jgi:hypothetical protein
MSLEDLRYDVLELFAFATAARAAFADTPAEGHADHARVVGCMVIMVVAMADLATKLLDKVERAMKT